MRADRELVILSCLHSFYYVRPAPKSGDRVYCPRCNEEATAAATPHDFSVNCRDCPWKRFYGRAAVTADTAAVKHSLRRPGHRVEVLDGDVVVESHWVRPLPASADLPPF
jgi:hypothetical protein